MHVSLEVVARDSGTRRRPLRRGPCFNRKPEEHMKATIARKEPKTPYNHNPAAQRNGDQLHRKQSSAASTGHPEQDRRAEDLHLQHHKLRPTLDRL